MNPTRSTLSTITLPDGTTIKRKVERNGWGAKYIDYHGEQVRVITGIDGLIVCPAYHWVFEQGKVAAK